MNCPYPHRQIVNPEDHMRGWGFGAARCSKCGFEWLAVYNADSYIHGNLLACSCCGDFLGEIISAIEV